MNESRATLPPRPTVELETMRETRLGEGGFLVLRRTELVTITDGQRSPSYPYDVVDRKALDAAIMAAHHEAEGRVWVWLRSSLRPPLQLRHGETRQPAVLWELPAGLIEPNESPRAGAVRELAEELGFAVQDSAMKELGGPAFPAPALIGELHYFFHVRVDPKTRTEPGGDGSHVEAGATVICVPLDELLAACRRGEVQDEKTELALRRLADVLLPVRP